MDTVNYDNILIDSGETKTINLKPREKLVHIQFLENEDNRLSVNLAEESSYIHFLIQHENISSEMNVILNGEKAEVKLYGLIMPKQNTSIKTCIQHQSNASYSEQEYRYILNSSGQNYLEADLAILKYKEHNKALQFCRGLILQENASLKAKPSLRIANEQVECSHGVALGKLDETALHYLNGRGISTKVATSMLVHAFANYIIEKLPTSQLRQSALLKLQAVL